MAHRNGNQASGSKPASSEYVLVESKGNGDLMVLRVFSVLLEDNVDVDMAGDQVTKEGNNIVNIFRESSKNIKMQIQSLEKEIVSSNRCIGSTSNKRAIALVENRMKETRLSRNLAMPGLYDEICTMMLHQTPLFLMVIKLASWNIRGMTDISKQNEWDSNSKESSKGCRIIMGWDPNSFITYLLSKSDQVMPYLVTTITNGELPAKYLRVPLVCRRLSKVEYKCLIDCVKKKINDWRNKYLSYAGRLQLIASILSSLQEEHLGITSISWKDICTPKSQGGLGLKPLHKWNEALMTKHLWNIMSNKDSI
ncbi:hypothetical protein Tco_1216090 [Tanacetum coccineum]